MDYIFTLESQCDLVPCGVHDGLGGVLLFKTEAAACEHVEAIPRHEWIESGAVVGWSRFETLDLPPKHDAMSPGTLYRLQGASVVALWGRRAYDADGTPFNDGLDELGGYWRLVRVPVGP